VLTGCCQQPVNTTHDYTNFCFYRVDPPDDEQQACSKHVEAYYCSKLIENSVSCWFTEILGFLCLFEIEIVIYIYIYIYIYINFSLRKTMQVGKMDFLAVHYTYCITLEQSGSQFTTCMFYVHHSTCSKQHYFLNFGVLYSSLFYFIIQQ